MDVDVLQRHMCVSAHVSSRGCSSAPVAWPGRSTNRFWFHGHSACRIPTVVARNRLISGKAAACNQSPHQHARGPQTPATPTPQEPGTRGPHAHGTAMGKRLDIDTCRWTYYLPAHTTAARTNVVGSHHAHTRNRYQGRALVDTAAGALNTAYNYHRWNDGMCGQSTPWRW